MAALLRRGASASAFLLPLRSLCIHPHPLNVLKPIPCSAGCCRYADKASMEVGLLFTCRLGDVDLERPVGEWLGVVVWRA